MRESMAISIVSCLGTLEYSPALLCRRDKIPTKNARTCPAKEAEIESPTMGSSLPHYFPATPFIYMSSQMKYSQTQVVMAMVTVEITVRSCISYLYSTVQSAAGCITRLHRAAVFAIQNTSSISLFIGTQTTARISTPLKFLHPHSLQLRPHWLSRLLRNFLEHITLQSLRLLGARPPLHNLSIPTNQELLKVPLHALHAHQPRLLALDVLPQRIGIIAIDLRLAEDGERDAVVDLAELLDLVVGCGLLAAELVAGEAEDDEFAGVRGFDLLVEGFESAVLGGEAALGGGVDDEEDFAGVGGEGCGFALLCWGS